MNLTPSTDVDLFRIKIWDKDTDEVVYDNQMGDEEDADPTYRDKRRLNRNSRGLVGGSRNLSKKWMPITAGVIEIVSSMFQLMVFAFLLANFMFGWVFYEHDVIGESRGWLGKSGYLLVTSVSVLMGFLAMVGGIYSLERKRFNLSLTGALAACFAVVLPLYFYASDFPRIDWPLNILLTVSVAGIVAMILILLSKKEYK